MFKRRKKICWACGAKVNDNWNYCPNCGTKFNDKDMQEDMLNTIKNLEKVFSSLDKMFAFTIGVGNDNISITFGDNRIGEAGERTKQVKTKTEKVMKLPSNVEEPAVSFQNLGKSHKIFVNLPGVSRLDDIEVRLLEQSIEIRAKGKEKGYFKIIPLPFPAILLKKELNNSTLTLVLERQT